MRRLETERERWDGRVTPWGELVQFPPRALLPRRSEEDGATSGTILLFTGIRYERHVPVERDADVASVDDHGPAPSGAGRRGPRRRA